MKNIIIIIQIKQNRAIYVLAIYENKRKVIYFEMSTKFD